MRKKKESSSESLLNSLKPMETVLKHLTTKVTKLSDLLSASKQKLRNAKREKRKAECDLKNIEGAQTFLRELAERIQSEVHKQVADVVSKCLRNVFANHPDGPYEFKIKFVKKRNKTDAVLLFTRNGMELDPQDEAGGGVLDVASFALRLACALSSQPAVRKLMVLDEPFRHVSIKLRPIVASLLAELAKETGTQFIVVTHITEISEGHVVKLS